MTNDLHNHIANMVKREVLRDVGIEPLNENMAPSKEILICRGNWGTDNQNLTESPMIYESGTFSVYVDPTPTTNYFKVYDGPGPKNADHICRISVVKAEYVTGHKNKYKLVEFTLNAKRRKKLIEVLKDNNEELKMSNYNAIIYHLNTKYKGGTIPYNAIDINKYKEMR